MGPASWKFEGLKFLKVLLAFGAASTRKGHDGLTLSDAERTPFSRPNFHVGSSCDPRPRPVSLFIEGLGFSGVASFSDGETFPDCHLGWVGRFSRGVNCVCPWAISRCSAPLQTTCELPGICSPRLQAPDSLELVLSHGLAVQCEV